MKAIVHIKSGLIFIKIQLAATMQRVYGNKPAISPKKSTSPERAPKQRSKQQLRQWESTLNMISLLLKNHVRQSTLQSLGKLKRHWVLKKKYSSFLANKLNLLQRRKCRQYFKLSFSALLSNRINYYTTRKAESNRMKDFLKAKAANLMAIIEIKTEKNRLKTTFQELKARIQLKSKMGTFKNVHLFSRISGLLAQRLKLSLLKIDRWGKKRVQNLRRLSRVEKLVVTKSKNHLLSAFTKLRVNLLQLRAKQSREKQQKASEAKEQKAVPVVVQKNNDKQNQAEIKKLQGVQRTLNQKKKNLEKEVAKLEVESERTLTEFKKDITRLESENEELGFNNGLLEESNQQLERQLQNRQKSSRKRLSKKQIWENVYNNLLYFLSINKDKEITKDALLQCLEMPLVPCNINLEELNDENRVLSQLLEEYKKNFPAPAVLIENQPELLPFEVIRKQNKYYYMVLEVLSEWGKSGSKQLQQLNNDLTSLQKRLAS